MLKVIWNIWFLNEDIYGTDINDVLLLTQNVKNILKTQSLSKQNQHILISSKSFPLFRWPDPKYIIINRKDSQYLSWLIFLVYRLQFFFLTPQYQGQGNYERFVTKEELQSKPSMHHNKSRETSPNRQISV